MCQRLMKFRRKTARTPVFDSSTMCISGTKPAMRAIVTEPMIVTRYGVWYFGWILPMLAGRRPSRETAKKMRA